MGFLGDIAGSVLDSVLGESSAEKAHSRNLKFAKNQYQYMMKDMEKAGLNPMLASKMGPLSLPASPMNPNSAVAANSSKIGQTQAHTKQLEVQTEIQENVAEIASNFMDAWRNTGKHFTQWLKDADWEMVGNIIGNAIGKATDEVIDTIKNMFPSPEKAIEHFLRDEQGSVPEGGTGTFRSPDGSYMEH
jgi:hypothetical protein